MLGELICFLFLPPAVNCSVWQKAINNLGHKEEEVVDAWVPVISKLFSFLFVKNLHLRKYCSHVLVLAVICKHFTHAAVRKRRKR